MDRSITTSSYLRVSFEHLLRILKARKFEALDFLQAVRINEINDIFLGVWWLKDFRRLAGLFKYLYLLRCSNLKSHCNILHRLILFREQFRGRFSGPSN